jgi:hypothetical protein
MRKLVLFDDREARQGKPDVLATCTVRLSLEVIPLDGTPPKGDARELDLSAGNYTALLDDMSPWLSAGRVTEALGARARPEPTAGKVPMSRLGPPGGSNSTERRDWWARLRRWSDSLGLVSKRDPTRPAWLGPGGNMTYPVKVVEGFSLHEQGREAEALARVAEFIPGQQKAS